MVMCAGAWFPASTSASPAGDGFLPYLPPAGLGFLYRPVSSAGHAFVTIPAVWVVRSHWFPFWLEFNDTTAWFRCRCCLFWARRTRLLIPMPLVRLEEGSGSTWLQSEDWRAKGSALWFDLQGGLVLPNGICGTGGTVGVPP